MNPYVINPPTSDEVFEELCLALLKRHWSRPGLERFGKKGERQFGVDVLDTLGESPLYAGQCKLKETWKSLEPAEIQDEVAKAKNFPSKLDHYVILTSAKVSTAAQLAVQAINQEHRAAGLFTVEVFHWNRISDLIRQYPDIEQQFVGGMRSEEVAEVKSKLDYIASLAESVASSVDKTEIDAMIDDARNRLNAKEAQIAVLLLNRVLQTKGGELSDWHRYRIHTNLGVANLLLGKANEAARFFLDAKLLRPEDELAVVNEVLAYHLLLEDNQTREKAEIAVARFPNSTRIRALWLQAQPLERPYEELLAATPGHMRKDAEVASALSRRALSEGLLDIGIAHAEDAVADKPAWAQSQFSLAQAYFGRVALADSSKYTLNAAERKDMLVKVIAEADKAIALAESEGVLYVKAGALALKVDVALMEGRKDDATRLAREAFEADPSESIGRLAMAQAAFGKGNADEGIDMLEEAQAKSNNAPNVSFMLGQALMARGKGEDFNRAYEVFTTAKIDGLSRELSDPLIVGAIRALVRAQRFSEVPEYVARPEVSNSQVLCSTIEGYVALKQEDTLKAEESLNTAVSERKPDDSRCAIDFLARTLMEAGRLSDALPLLQELFNTQAPNFDVGLLLNCASRLRERKVILEVCESIIARGEGDWELLEFESQFLEEDDFPKAIERLQEFIKANPDHRIAKIRLSTIAMRYGKKELITLAEDDLPSADELPMRYAIAVVNVLQWQGRGRLAVEYSYEVLRSHSSELEAHKAFLASILPGARPADLPPVVMEEVQVGSAVQYTEADVASAEWVVIEETDKPCVEFDELAASSERAREMLGKRVGESFIVAKSTIKDRVGTVLQITSKFARRFQVIGDEMQKQFGDQSVIQMVRIPTAELLSLTDLQPMLDSAKAQSEAVFHNRALYKSGPVPLHLYGSSLGHNAYEALIDLAVSEKEFINCAPAQRELLAAALTALGTKSTVVIDLVALGTLRLLGITRQILTSGAFRFVISPATYAELQQMRMESQFSVAHGTLGYVNDQPSFTETSEEQIGRQRAAFEEWMKCIEDNTTIVPVPEIVAMPVERRETLEKVFGACGLESALLAKAAGHILWTDDGIFGEVAKTELGIERAWSQVIIEHLANIGLLDRAASNEAYAKLVGFSYNSTHFDDQTMLAAIRISNGSVQSFPTLQMIGVFSELYSQNKNTTFRLLAGFFIRLFMEPFLPETRCLVVQAFLDAFPDDQKTRTLLESFSKQLMQLLFLNPVGAEDFRKCFEQWKRRRNEVSLNSGPNAPSM